MIVHDNGIKAFVEAGFLKIIPYEEKYIQPASYELHLADTVHTFDKDTNTVVSPGDDITTEYELDGDPYYLQPGDFILASTIERVEIPANLVAKVEGKSSLGRIGLLVHATAGYVDPGFRGNLTIQLKNIGLIPIKLTHGMKICQLSFVHTVARADRPYGSKGLGSNYQDSSGVHNGSRKVNS